MSAPKPRILVVDDETDLLELLELTLLRMGFDVDPVPSVAAARACLERQRYGLVLTDMRLGDGSGLDVLQASQRQQPGVPVTVITAYGSAENAVSALKAGAFDYLSKPVELDRLRALVRSALGPAKPQASSANTRGGAWLEGESLAMQRVRERIERVARSMAPVMITGESGSGKEVAARMIHELGARNGQPFVAVNCGAIPESLMEAEFFGYRKGAFTGAEQERDGFFQAANGGTLLLDEVGELPLAMQVKLLRAIQERRVRKVGATTEEPVDVRLVAATHRDLSALVQSGQFRQDLYYRLNVLDVQLPPLRERSEDIPQLARLFIERQNRGGPPITLSAPAMAALLQHPFPGNVRELENVLERALALCERGRIESSDLGLQQAGSAITRGTSGTPIPQRAVQATPELEELPSDLGAHLDQIERDILERALAASGGNRTRAGEMLGLNLRQMRYRMQRLGIQP